MAKGTYFIKQIRKYESFHTTAQSNALNLYKLSKYEKALLLSTLALYLVVFPTDVMRSTFSAASSNF